MTPKKFSDTMLRGFRHFGRKKACLQIEVTSCGSRTGPKRELNTVVYNKSYRIGARARARATRTAWASEQARSASGHHRVDSEVVPIPRRPSRGMASWRFGMTHWYHRDQTRSMIGWGDAHYRTQCHPRVCTYKVHLSRRPRIRTL
jgi:hypothetical protein